MTDTAKQSERAPMELLKEFHDSWVAIEAAKSNVRLRGAARARVQDAAERRFHAAIDATRAALKEDQS